MQVQGLPVSPEGLTISRTAPHYSLVEILWLLTYPNIHLKTPCSFPFPMSLVFSHWHKDHRYCPCWPGSKSPAIKVQLSPCLRCARLWLLLPCAEVLTGGTVWGWWQLLHLAPCVFLPGRAAGFWYLLWATCVEALGWFTAFHTKHMRWRLLLAQAASTSACATLCWAQPLLQGRQWGLHLPSSRAGSYYSQ